MEKLANGINPLNDAPIPEYEVVNNVRLSRCFFYVANVLGQVIDERSAPTKIKSVPRTAFNPSAVQTEKVELSDTPIPVSELAKRISAGTDATDMRRLSFNAITKWLVTIGALEEYAVGEGKTAKRPTEHGRALGIFTEERTGQEGPYHAVLYSRSAQQFVLDNLGALQGFVPPSKENKGQPWSIQEDERLAELYGSGFSVGEIAVRLKRSSNGIRSRLKKLGIVE